MPIQVNQLIITSADYKIILIADGVAFPLLTVEGFSFNHAAENEDIYAVGQEDPIGNKTNAVKRSGKLSMQNGEMAVVLQTLGYAESIKLRGCTIAVASKTGVFTKSWGGVNINSEAVDIKAKDKQSLISMDWSALTVK